MQKHTFADLSRDYLAWMERRLQQRQVRHTTIACAKSLFDCHILPAFGNRELDSLTPMDVEAWHQRIAQKYPTTANRAVQCLRTAWNHAERWGWVAPNVNPGRFLRHHKAPERARQRVLSRDELRASYAILARLEGNPATPPKTVQAVQVLRLLIETGCRKMEIVNLTWPEVDLTGEYPCLRLTDSKTGPKVVYLSGEAVAVLERVPVETPGGYLFPEPALKTTWDQVKTELGAPDLTLHDLRRTMSSSLAWAGVPSEDVARLLGQKTVRVNRDHYRVLEARGLSALANTASRELRGMNHG